MIGITSPAWELWDIRGVVFDKDGTITDVNLYWGKVIELRAEEIAKRTGVDKSWIPGLQKAMGWDCGKKVLLPDGPIAILPRKDVIEILYRYLLSMKVETKRDSIIAAFDSAQATFETCQNDYTKLLPGVEQFIKKLAVAGVPMWLITSDATTSAVAAMKHLGLNTYFTQIRGREPGMEANKENGILCREVITAKGIDPTSCIAIGDTLTDCRMAKNALLNTCIGVFTGQVTRAILETETPYTISSMSFLDVVEI